MRIGLYPGTFDPATNGHLDIIGRAVKLVDRLVVGVAVNEAKGPLFSLEERVEMVREETARFGADIVVQPFDSLLMRFAEQVEANVIVRGLRAVADFEYGIQSFFKPFYVWYSIIKTIFFAFIIASVSAFFGYHADGGSLEVGKASTNAVVISSILILISDLVLTNLMMQ